MQLPLDYLVAILSNWSWFYTNGFFKVAERMQSIVHLEIEKNKIERDYTCVLDQSPGNFGSGMSGYNALFTLEIKQNTEKKNYRGRPRRILWQMQNKGHDTKLTVSVSLTISASYNKWRWQRPEIRPWFQEKSRFLGSANQLLVQT